MGNNQRTRLLLGIMSFIVNQGGFKKMKRQLTFIEKLHIFWRWMKHSSESLICSCEYCRSTRIERISPENYEYEEPNGEIYKRYKTNYLCLNCGALAIGTETWSDNHLKKKLVTKEEQING